MTEQKQKTKWGGKRVGAGAPGKPRASKVPLKEKLDRYYGTKVDDYLEAWLEVQRLEGESDAQLLRRLLLLMQKYNIL